MAAANINPYLVDAPDVLLQNRSRPICNVPLIKFGNQPIDGGHLLFTNDEKADFLAKEPKAEKFFRRYMGSVEFINGIERWCLWLKDVNPAELRQLPYLMNRLDKVRKFRLDSTRQATRDLASTPSAFAFVSHTDTPYLLIPSVSSERRSYIPIALMQQNVIASNLCLIVPNASVYHFGVISSSMHMSWVKSVCGRLKSDYRYSNSIVYNNFPWPEHLTAKQKLAVEQAAQAVLDARANHLSASLADLYDPNTMPSDLAKAHRALDATVDAAYAKKRFSGDTDRVSFLFEMYQTLAEAK